MNLRNKLSVLGIDEDRILKDEPMARHTSFRIGGPAAWFITVNDENELSGVLRYLTENDIRHMLVGNGSNLLFADAGYDGVVVRLGGEFQDAAVTGGVLAAGGACLLSRAAAVACEHGLAGLEFASGIPGSVGGALFMNAGAYGGEIKDVCVRARLMTPDGAAVYERDAADLAFAYRSSALQRTGEVVLRADFALAQDDPSGIQARMKELNERRTSKQPLNFPSAGSTFKRPVGGFAAALIDQAGLKGSRVGGAMVSDKHAGFVINVGGATAADVLALMRIVSDRVYEMSGIRLEPEVRIIQ